MRRERIAFEKPGCKARPEGAPLPRSHSGAIPSPRPSLLRGFTLIEMLVVVGIIGILAAISLPAMKGIGQANLTAAANRQLLDDLSYARLRAISDRTTVYMVFVPPNITDLLTGTSLRPEDRRIVSNLVSMQYGGYALISSRTVGDQPGQSTLRYLTEWKPLPDGMLIPPAKYTATPAPPREFGLSFDYAPFTFPRAQSRKAGDVKAFTANLPFIAFDARGQLISLRDQLIPLVRGTVFLPRTQDGQLDLTRSADVQTIPVKLATNDFQVVRVNWLTGRAKVEAADFRQ